ncbi:response regulator [bacterium]|jgi:FixJ family two-component response regulator/class 3 adenylate cyclase|nr:response regulator [bacterium]
MKPVIFYIDDEPHNLTVFEASLPDTWEIKTFDTPYAALAALKDAKPWILVSDQRMPGMNGVTFLQQAKEIVPEAVRIIVTGYSDENLVVESVRKAQIYDYIRKPWDVDELEQALTRAIDYYKANQEAKRLNEELKVREGELRQQTVNLLKLTSELETARKSETLMRLELECWVPPFVLWALRDTDIKFPIQKDLVGIAFDVVNSSKIHELKVGKKSARSAVIHSFSEAIIRNGGWRESHQGDSAYGHFGLLDDKSNPCDSALAVAIEFREAIVKLQTSNGTILECGVSLHVAKGTTVDVHTVELETPRGRVTQKSFDTTSAEVDMLHRMEKLVHTISGTNIVMSKAFVDQLQSPPAGLINLGTHLFKGQKAPIELFLLKSDQAKDEEIQKIIAAQGSKAA